MFLAPMEDVTDIGFRMLCKRFGAAMVYTEFVSAEALIRDVKSTVNKLTISDENAPSAYRSMAATWRQWWRRHRSWSRLGLTL